MKYWKIKSGLIFCKLRFIRVANSWNQTLRYHYERNNFAKYSLMRLNDERGSLLVIAMFVITIFIGMGSAMMLMSQSEAVTAERHKLSTQAFHIAEAGVERVLYDLRQDFVNDPTPSWADGDINGMNIGPNTSSYYRVPYANIQINGGLYEVDLKNVAGNDHIWIRSFGFINGVSHELNVYVRIVDISPWNTAIFAGSGASGTMINGNVDIRGSVHILGTGLNPGDYAMDLGGTSQLVGNNYSTLASALKAKVPALPTVVHNGETVETLNATLRVKNGITGLSGSATLGEADVTGNAYKETVDGAYINDGFGGNQGTGNVHSDNGFTTGYDLGNAVSFPSLSDPYAGYSTYDGYLRSNSLVLTTQLSNVQPNSSFSYSNAHGSISMDGAGNMTISGVVYVDGGNDMAFNKQGSQKTITYSGTGSILVTGNINVNTNLVTNGSNSFPTNIMGMMTPNNIDMNEAGIDVMGLFYAENTIRVQKQTDIMGTIVSNYFDMGTNVPSIYQVPETVNFMPTGMIGSNAKWYVVETWMKN